MEINVINFNKNQLNKSLALRVASSFCSIETWSLVGWKHRRRMCVLRKRVQRIYTPGLLLDVRCKNCNEWEKSFQLRKQLRTACNEAELNAITNKSFFVNFSFLRIVNRAMKTKPRNMIWSQSYACDHGNYFLSHPEHVCANEMLKEMLKDKNVSCSFVCCLGVSSEHAAKSWAFISTQAALGKATTS